MRISDTYEHDTLLPGSTAQPRPAACCEKEGAHCVDISAPLTLKPEVAVGPVSTVCQGEPEVSCVTGADGASCTLTITQRVCLSVPMCFGVSVAEEEPRIACGTTGKCGCMPVG